MCPCDWLVTKQFLRQCSSPTFNCQRNEGAITNDEKAQALAVQCTKFIVYGASYTNSDVSPRKCTWKLEFNLISMWLSLLLAKRIFNGVEVNQNRICTVEIGTWYPRFRLAKESYFM
jgi:hypothetical protein